MLLKIIKKNKKNMMIKLNLLLKKLKVNQVQINLNVNMKQKKKIKRVYTFVKMNLVPFYY